MAKLIQPLSDDDLRRLGVGAVRKSYTDIAKDYRRIIDREISMCPMCGDWLETNKGFYVDERYVSGRYPICKRCLMRIVENRKTDKDKPNETKESVQKVLRMLDRVYDDNFYNECVKGAYDSVKEKNRNSPFATYITAILSLPNWKGKTWEHSYFGDELVNNPNESEITENSKIIKKARKRFGLDYNLRDLYFLETEYEDWTSRYPCENKAQEILFKRICCKELEIEKAQKNGADTKDLDKTLQDLMASMQIKPSQSNSNSLTEAKSFGELIGVWEREKPIPEPEGVFKDIDKIGLLIDVFYKGHLSKMMGLKNAFSSIYEKFIKKYSVEKNVYEEDEDSEVLFNQIFADGIDDEI